MNRARSDQAEQALVGAAQDFADGPARIDHGLGDGLVDPQLFLEPPRSDQLPGRNYVQILNLLKHHNPTILAETRMPAKAVVRRKQQGEKEGKLFRNAKLIDSLKPLKGFKLPAVI